MLHSSLLVVVDRRKLRIFIGILPSDEIILPLRGESAKCLVPILGCLNSPKHSQIGLNTPSAIDVDVIDLKAARDIDEVESILPPSPRNQQSPATVPTRHI